MYSAKRWVERFVYRSKGVGFIVYLFEDKIEKSHLVKLLAILPADEKNVLKILFDRKEIEQKKLTALSGLSAVKISRVMSILEKRGIIEKKKQGYTNLIIMKM